MLLLVDIEDTIYNRIMERKNASLYEARILIGCIINSAPLPHGICGVIANGEPLPDDVKDGE